MQQTDAEGLTLLHYAVLYNQPKIVSLLVEKGMDPNVKSKAGKSPLLHLEDSLVRAEDARAAIIAGGGIS